LKEKLFSLFACNMCFPTCFAMFSSPLHCKLQEKLPRITEADKGNTLSLPCCRFHVVASMLSLPCCRVHVVASKLSLPCCRFQVVASGTVGSGKEWQACATSNNGNFYPILPLYIFSLTSTSVSDFPFFLIIIGDFLKICCRDDWFCIWRQFSMKTCLRFVTAGWYCVTKDKFKSRLFAWGHPKVWRKNFYRMLNSQ